MEIYKIQGEDRRDCELKIMERYKRPFHIWSQKEIRLHGGFLGLFPKKGVEVEFYFHPILNNNIDLEEQKKRVITAAGKDPEEVAVKAAKGDGERQDEGGAILKELREIKEKIESGAAKKDDHPSLARAVELFRLNDFSETYTAGMIERIRKELPLETLEDFDAVQARLLTWIGESIDIYREPASPRRRGRILALVGPTGVGKTTTIAKLAAKFRLGHTPPLSVRMITIDAFRIGAREQIEKYGEIMDLPASYIDNSRDLKREISLHQDEADLILVDTIGKGPKDSAKLGEMKELLDACGSRADIHLALSASTKASDITVILRQFEIFNYRSVLLTKLDETSHVGNVISALAERKKPVSWITNGQKVPSDIKKASVVQFLINLEEFKIDRDIIEKRFPVDEAEQLQWS